MNLKVLIIDDHRLFREGLQSLLQRRNIDVVAAVGDGNEGLKLAKELSPDVILLDMRMPIIDGISVLIQLRKFELTMPTKISGNIWTALCGLLIVVSVTELAHSDDTDQDRYLVCQQSAQRISGYYGPVPNKYLPGGALSGAVKGAAAGAAVGWIGGKKVDTKKAAKRGAALGALVGALKRAGAKNEEKKRRRAYEFELQACMSVGDAR